MGESVDSVRSGEAEDAGEDPREAERRVFRDTCIAAAFAVVVGALIAPWRVTTGLLLGGSLAVLNHYWLRESVASVFGDARPGVRPRLGASRYFLRYFVVVAAVCAAVSLGVVSLVATLGGMCAVVAGLLAEGARQFYFAIMRREEG